MDSFSILMSAAAANKPLDTPDNTDLIAHLKRLTLRHFDLVNTRDWTNPAWRDMTPDFQSFGPSTAEDRQAPPIASSRESHIAGMKAVADACPDYTVEPRDCVVEINRAGDGAVVWVILVVYSCVMINCIQTDMVGSG